MQPALRIPPPEWVTDPETSRLLDAVTAGGSLVRFVGGCVRDTLLGCAIGDIDVATPDPPEAVMALLERAGIPSIPTGLAHGTVTARLPGRQFEITTLRRDIETDGRHARIAFTADWRADAARRDFTMNALFLDRAGAVYDSVGGIADLRAGRIRFVGDAGTRIREDVLRLLRFYRFQAHYGRVPPEGVARQACRDLAHLLPTLSGERIAAELRKLLSAPDPIPALAMMDEDGVLAVIIPHHNDLRTLRNLVAVESEVDPLRRLAALLDNSASVEALANRLRLSNAERERLLRLVAPPMAVALDASPREQRRALHRLGLATYRDLVMLCAAARGGAVESASALLASAAEAVPAEFPLRGRDVAALGIAAGPAIGRLLARTEAWWEEEDFLPDRAACLVKLAAFAREEGVTIPRDPPDQVGG